MKEITVLEAFEAYKRLIAGYYSSDRDMEFDVTLLNEFFMEQMRKEGTL